MGALHALKDAPAPTEKVRAKILDQIPEHPSRAPQSSRAAKERAARIGASILREALHSAGLTYGALGKALGVATSTAANYCSPSETRGFTLANVVRAGWSHPEILYEVGIRLVELAELRAHKQCSAKHLRLVTKDLGRAADTVDEALADDHITPDESRMIDKDVAKLIRRALVWRADLQRHYGLR